MTIQDANTVDPSFTTPDGKPLNVGARNPHLQSDVIHGGEGGGNSAESTIVLELVDYVAEHAVGGSTQRVVQTTDMIETQLSGTSPLWDQINGYPHPPYNQFSSLDGDSSWKWVGQLQTEAGKHYNVTSSINWPQATIFVMFGSEQRPLTSFYETMDFVGDGSLVEVGYLFQANTTGGGINDFYVETQVGATVVPATCTNFVRKIVDGVVTDYAEDGITSYTVVGEIHAHCPILVDPTNPTESIIQLVDVYPTGGSVQTPLPSSNFGASSASPSVNRVDISDQVVSYSFVDLNNPANSDALWTTPTDTNPFIDNLSEIFSYAGDSSANPAIQFTLANAAVVSAFRMVGPSTGPIVSESYFHNGAGEVSPIGQHSEWIDPTNFAQQSDVYSFNINDDGSQDATSGVFERVYVYSDVTSGAGTVQIIGNDIVFDNQSTQTIQAQTSVVDLVVGRTYTIGASFSNGFSGMHWVVDGIGEILPFTNAQFTATSTYHELRLQQDAMAGQNTVSGVTLYSQEDVGMGCRPFLRKIIGDVVVDLELDAVTPYAVVGQVDTKCPSSCGCSDELTSLQVELDAANQKLQLLVDKSNVSMVNTGQPVITLGQGTWNKATITQFLNTNHYDHFVDTNAGYFASYGYNEITFLPATTMTLSVHGLPTVTADYPMSLQANKTPSQLEEVDDFELVIAAGATVDVSMIVWLTGVAA